MFLSWTGRSPERVSFGEEEEARSFHVGEARSFHVGEVRSFHVGEARSLHVKGPQTEEAQESTVKSFYYLSSPLLI